MIDGVKVKKLRWLPDERGRLMEVLRCDDELFEKFGQVYITTVYPGVVKAWHYHKNQTDNIGVIHGMAKLVLYDDRPESPTKGEVTEFFAGEVNPILVQIPPQVLHGFKGTGDREALIINVPNQKYNHTAPDEYRTDPHDNDIPYDWSRRDG